MLYSESWEKSSVERTYLVIKANKSEKEWWLVTFRMWRCFSIMLASTLSSSLSSLFFLQYVLNWEMHRMPMVHAETNGAYQGGIFIVIIIIAVIVINEFGKSGKAKIYSAKGKFSGLNLFGCWRWGLHGGSLMFLVVPVTHGSRWFLMVSVGPWLFWGSLEGAKFNLVLF